MEILRAGERQAPPKRSQRIYREGKNWYFNTREGAPIGPFEELKEAIAWLDDYVNYTKHAPSLADLIAV
ncbi:hypothetical protein NBRC116493_35540 [Aurantivibrio infirmus]